MRLLITIMLMAVAISASAIEQCATKHHYRNVYPAYDRYINSDPTVATQTLGRIPVGFLADDAPISYTFNMKPDGIAVELFEYVMQQICFEDYDLIPYSSHEAALDDLRQNKIAIILGDFSYNAHLWDKHIESSPSFFVDKDVLFSSLDDLSFASIFSVIWSDLLKDTLLISMIISLLVCAILFVAEGNSHPSMKEQSILNKCIYTFYQIWCCFFRDLIFNPVTNAGRLVMSFWIIFSLVMVTVLTSLLTSNIILLNTDSASRISSPAVMYFNKVGYLHYHENLLTAINRAHGEPVPYDSIHDIIDGVLDGDVQFGVGSKVLLENYISRHPELIKDIILSNVAISYENFSMLYSPQFALTTLHHDFNAELHHVIETEFLYGLCSKHNTAPEHCLVA